MPENISPPNPPLVPLPIIDVPFLRIAMDIVRPLLRSSSGKRFILVICDYATRYPEAIPLRSIDANRIAKALISFFARVGVPEEILTDQGTNFTSQLMQEVYKLLQIRPIRTTPYHRWPRREVQQHPQGNAKESSKPRREELGRTTPVSSLCLQRSPTSLHGLLPF